MLRIVTAALLALIVAEPASSAPLQVYDGSADGHRYNYTVEAVGKNFLRLSGTMLDSGQGFVLLVSPDGEVTGNFGYSPVAFKVSKTTRDKAAAAIAAQAIAAEGETLTTASR
ncbi:MAG TPA: hypothetical protein VF750_06755 [Sphingomicrobium sp.]